MKNLISVLSHIFFEMNGKNPLPVLSDEFCKPVELTDVYIATIFDKKLTSSIIKQLQQLYPLGSLQHLKRVRSSSKKDGPLQVILCKVCDASYSHDKETSKNTIQDEQGSKSKPNISAIDGLGHPYYIKVPSTAPLTRKQYEESIKYWPVNFHEDKIIARLLSGKFFNSSEIDIIEKHMTAALTMATISQKKDQLQIGAVIVDPTTDTIIAKAFDLREDGHPLQHAVMVAIDLVAHSQGGGMWHYIDESLFFQTTKADSSSKEKMGPYLCTGYDLYVTQEPCVMCSMALVHSRIGRVFYGSSAVTGALGSHHKVHCQQGLNHHYSVFKNVLSQETDKLYCENR